MNGYLSAMRNSIITTSLGVAIYGFSRSFKKKSSRNIMKRLSVLVYFFSFIIIINSSSLLRNYLNSITDEDKKEFPKYIDLEKWRYYEYLGWFFSTIVFVIILLGLMGDIKKIIKLIFKHK
tara:strand:+ start:129 stop:491 length:363 start_codon:yes stop_codon:yes gene_type:complete